MFFHCRTGIERFHARSEPFCGRDCLQTGDTDADHKNARRLDRTGRRDHHRKDPIKLFGRENHGEITGEAPLRTERIHLLRDARSRNHLHADRAHFRRGELLDQIAFVERIEKADMNRALAERSDFLDRGLSQSQHNVCFAQSSHPIINHRSPSVLVFRVAAID